MTEKQVLGGIIVTPEIMDEVADFIEERWFTDPNGKVWALISELYENNLPIDTVSLYQESLKRGYDLKPILFSQLSEEISSGANVPYHARILKEQFLAKETLRNLDNTKSQIEAKEDIFEVLESHTQKVMDLTTDKNDGGEEVSQSVRRVVTHLEKIHAGDNQGMWVNTGYYELDEKIKLMNKELTYIAARPSMGKTALMLNMIRNIAEEDYVGVFSLEMGNDQLTTRLLSTETGIPYMKLLTGKVKDEDGSLIARTSHKISKLKIFIDDSAGLSPMQVLTKARRMKKKYNIKILFVDYVGLMAYEPLHQNRNLEMSYISARLKSLAKDLNIPVVALSQLSRGVESRSSKRPQLSDLRDSGSLEQDADTVVFLYRPEYYGDTTLDNGDSAEGICQLLVRKNRNGGTGDVNLRFRKEIMKFENLEVQF